MGAKMVLTCKEGARRFAVSRAFTLDDTGWTGEGAGSIFLHRTINSELERASPTAASLNEAFRDQATRVSVQAPLHHNTVKGLLPKKSSLMYLRQNPNPHRHQRTTTQTHESYVHFIKIWIPSNSETKSAQKTCSSESSESAHF